MKLRQYHQFLLAILVAFNFVYIPTVVSAQEEICIEVYPCLEDGSLDKIYDVPGFCGDKFRALCKAVQSDLSSSKLSSCQQENTDHLKSLESQQQQIEKLQKQLRKAKRKNK